MLRLLLFAAVLLCACSQQPETVQLHGATMGTTWSVSLHSLPDGIKFAELKQQVQQRLDRVNELMSTYDPASEISRFNRSTSLDWFPLSTETAEVIALSLEISALTDGAFDISVGPLVELWGFGASERDKQLPTDEQVLKVLDGVGYRKLELRRQPAAIRKKHPQVQLDLSAVAKGFAVDLLAELLKQRGVKNFLVEVGGELQVAGRRYDGTPWRIAIEKPREGVREVEQVFPLTNTALATSGNYRNFYVEDGQRYVHTIDPISGKPIRHKLASATVLDPHCARADALATAMMVLGEERARRLVEQEGIAAYFLIHEQNTLQEYRSQALNAFLAKERP
ncbi:FAD:protein FMN transferase [Malonomonas rubra]|uniref:FAD:protein FMN transferase n=1 Tax=Malonomonas rubra TaxID=57040 RepID=UPI0026F2775E|nr:FAD:protein FMN transferase [Malonomonas rubra]